MKKYKPKVMLILVMVILVIGILFISEGRFFESYKRKSDFDYSFIIDNENKYRVYVIEKFPALGDTSVYWYDIDLDKNIIELRYNLYYNVAEGHKGKDVYNGLKFLKKLSKEKAKELKTILDNALKENLSEVDRFNIDTYDDPNIIYYNKCYYIIKTEKTDSYKNGNVLINNSNDMKKFMDIIKK